MKTIWADGAQTRVALVDDEGFREIVPIVGKVTGNHGEWLALIHALDFVHKLGYNKGEVEIRMDSQLIVNQFNGLFRVKAPNMAKLFVLSQERWRDCTNRGTYPRAVWIPREENRAGWLLEGR